MSVRDLNPRRQAERVVRWNEERIGAYQGIRGAMRYVFPDHWSFLVGEIALYSFIVLIITGVYLALFYVPSTQQSVYHGSYVLLQGEQMSGAYRSVLDLSLDVPAGLLVRQTHHWAADVFLAAIVLHMMRVFFTGAYRKPRDLNWYIGLTMLGLAIIEGFLGYSLVDDLLSGMGLAIAYSTAMSVPFIGGQFANLVWDGPFPGSSRLFARFEIIHVFIIPAILTLLITVHLAMIVRQHHSQFPGPGRREQNVVGTPMWPAYALRSLGLLFAVAAVLVLLGGLIQINPIWQWGPYHTYLSENGAQPDWYIGWLIGALRLMPNWEVHIGGATIIPSPFWGGVLFPTVVFGVLYAWPWLERRITGDRAIHHLDERPRDRPIRTAIGTGFLSWVVLIFIIGASDRLFFRLDIPYTSQIRFWRIGVWIVPLLIGGVTLMVCRHLQRTDTHPLRGWEGTIVEAPETIDGAWSGQHVPSRVDAATPGRGRSEEDPPPGPADERGRTP
ncbi:cytochrome bc complex cytochrome b subunit [Conexibacter sp. DBS9H8]|uniref:cytochrome bc1 complex cytochrome b subunit n=1 Tax=Conexibacter sp. DBS9H8 TaxID=2937801 RepID=UPI00200BE575|nr:cytochrome bc complex cytochrome b subunit [Conexibacter sp. DBS9H8]